ncbi:hypothetical protein SmphiM6_59 [Sinorhizobium phage phiM6]|nr:hypothetical protein SmphiM6_59 [Sinorhizobium phage phiM6]
MVNSKDKYSEYLIEYDNEALVVYLSGLDEDDFWIELNVWDEVNDPESFAQGVQEVYKSLEKFSTILKVEPFGEEV